MQLISFLSTGRERVGALVDDAIVDLNLAATSLACERGHAHPEATAAALVPSDLLSLLQAGEPGLIAARESLDHVAALEPARAQEILVPLAATQLLPLLPRPPKIVCVARNFGEHAREAGLPISETPILFARFAETLVAHGSPIVRPTVSDQLDWEGELAVVIGRRGRHVRQADAMRYVAGFSIFNDVTVRDYQFRVTQYTAGKNFAASGPFGPTLVLTDEIDDPAALEITTELNGEVVQQASLSDMIFDVPTIIEHISEFITLQPGDVIPMGTPSGVGFKRNPPRFLRPGDTVRVTIPRVGVLENPVVGEEELT